MPYNAQTNTITDNSGFTYTPNAVGLENYLKSQTPTATALKPVDPSTPVVMQPNQISGGQDLKITNPTYNAPITTANSVVTGASAAAPPEPTKLDTQNQTLVDDLTKLYGQDVGKNDALATAETAAGVDTFKKNLAQINSDILKRTAEYEKLSVDLNGQPIPMGFITGQQAQVRLQAASEIGLLNALALGMQGNLTQAQEAAARSVHLKYAAIEEEIQAKERQLNLIQPLLDKQQKEQAYQQALALDTQKQAIAEAKARDSQLQTLAVNAAAAGIPKNFIDQALASKNPVEATAIIAQANTYQQNKETIQAAGIKSLYANRGGEIQRSSDGYAFTSLDDFLKKTGISLPAAVAAGMVTDLHAAPDLKGTPTSYQEYVLAKQEGYKGTYMQYQTEDANRKAVRTTTNNTYVSPETKTVDKFNTQVSSWNMTGTREQFIRQLQGAFPAIDAGDIQRKVYEIYPNGYDS